jgi:phytoene dehydrogenase-like protein
MLERDLSQAEASLGDDGKAWRRLMEPFAKRWKDLAPEVLRPVNVLTRHPFLLARFGMAAFAPATLLSRVLFRGEHAKELFAGLAAHSFLSLHEPLSSAFGVLLGAAAHAAGWPIPRGGAQAITDTLCASLACLGGKVHTGALVESLASLAEYDLVMCDLTPRQLLQIGAGRFSSRYARRLTKYRYGPGVFKVDYALSHAIPWKAAECSRAATVHIGGSESEIAESEKAISLGRVAEKPFVLLAQPSLFDRTRAPEGKHTAWAYCHVPNGSNVDMLGRIEAQIERFAPGFRDCILARRVFSPAALESMDANLVGGDINGGALDIGQFLFRPTWRHYATSAKNIYICSSSTPPGGGVHGMCGYHAAKHAMSGMSR